MLRGVTAGKGCGMEFEPGREREDAEKDVVPKKVFFVSGFRKAEAERIMFQFFVHFGECIIAIFLAFSALNFSKPPDTVLHIQQKFTHTRNLIHPLTARP